MTQAELLQYVASALADLGIEYMIGGSQASIYYGEPRFTQDIDIVAQLDIDQISPLLERFPIDEFYVSADAAREAVETRSQFNGIHPASGLKIDIFVNKATEYDRLRLARRHSQSIGRRDRRRLRCAVGRTAGPRHHLERDSEAGTEQ